MNRSNACEILAHFSKNSIFEMFSPQIAKIKKSHDKSAMLNEIASTASVSKANIKNAIMGRLGLERYYVSIFQNRTNLNNPFQHYNSELEEIDNIYETSLTANGYIEGFFKSKFLGVENYDPNSDDISEFEEEDFDSISYYIPFRIKYYRKFIIIKYQNMLIGSVRPKIDGRMDYIFKDLFDQESLSDSIKDILNGFNLNLTTTNFTSGIKALVRTNKIDSVMVSCDDANNHGQHIRKLHKGSSKTFVEKTWYTGHDFFQTDRINPTNWYWTDPLVPSQKPEEYHNLWIDCNCGIMKKGKVTDEDLGYFIKKVLDNV